MKLPNRFPLFFILFLALGCNSVKPETPNTNATLSVETVGVAKDDSNTIAQKPTIKVGSFVSGAIDC